MSSELPPRAKAEAELNIFLMELPRRMAQGSEASFFSSFISLMKLRDTEEVLTSLLDIVQTGDMELHRVAACMVLGLLAEDGVSTPRAIPILRHVWQSSGRIQVAATYALYVMKDPVMTELAEDVYKQKGWQLSNESLLLSACSAILDTK